MYSGKLSRTVKAGQEKYPSLLGGLLYMPGTSSYVNIYGGTIANGVSALYNTSGGSGGNI